MSPHLSPANKSQLTSELSKIKFSLAHASASPEYVSNRVSNMVETWIADAVEDAVHGSVQSYSTKVEKSPAREKLNTLHHHLDRMRKMFEDHYEDGEDNPEILLANIEAELKNIELDELR